MTRQTLDRIASMLESTYSVRMPPDKRDGLFELLEDLPDLPAFQATKELCQELSTQVTASHIRRRTRELTVPDPSAPQERDEKPMLYQRPDGTWWTDVDVSVTSPHSVTGKRLRGFVE